MKITLLEEAKIPVRGGAVGLSLEDVNYALDGGLYAEQLENRNFEAKNVRGGKEPIVEEDGAYGWRPYPQGADVGIKIKTDRPLFPENPHYMRLTVEKGGQGVANKAYDGVCLRKGAGYKFSFYARSYDYKGKVAVGVYEKGTPVIVKKFSVKADGKWRRYSFRAKSKLDAEGADFAFLLSGAGRLHLDAFSMMPENAVMGVFRRDLVQMMKALKPAFVCFPGACAVVGNACADRYMWKDSIGQPERRKYHVNLYASYGADRDGAPASLSHYGQTLGVGYYEYFLLCEYLGAKPVPVVAVGADDDCETYVQEALDVVEFANGGSDTVWGRVRGEMGHAHSFRLEYIAAVGGTEESFALFAGRINENYPGLKVIRASARGSAQSRCAYACEDKFDASPAWLYAHTGRYDKTARGKKICCGCGAQSPSANEWETALAHAAFLTGAERNADVAVMSSYTPLFARLGYIQREGGMICFDGKSAYASASYYVQQMFSLYTGDYSLKVRAEEGECAYVSATEREGAVYVKVVNAGEEEVRAEFEGDFDFGSLARIVRLGGEPEAQNTPKSQFTVSPEEVAPLAPRSLALPPHSFSVLVFRK